MSSTKITSAPETKIPTREYRNDSFGQFLPEKKEAPRVINDKSIDFPSPQSDERKSQSESLRVSLEALLTQ